ncbi:MAG: phytoene desaturase family protein [bacterium]
MKDKSVIIIGAGFAGLSAGIYAQMNNYSSEIYEMHNLPGGLCTSWNRKGYTIDGCIHWLVGSSPKSGMYRLWQEVGVAKGRKFINLEEFKRYECPDGRTLIIYSDIDRLKNHLLEFSPQDEDAIEDFCRDIRMFTSFDQPSDTDPLVKKMQKNIKLGLMMTFRGNKMKKLLRTTAREYFSRFKDPVLREALEEVWVPDFSIMFMLFTLAWLHEKNAGYPLGGSLPMSRALEKRYTELGGKIHYRKKAEKITVEQDKAVGVLFSDGCKKYSDVVISAADGYSTIFNMLEGKYADEKTKQPYESWKIFPPLVYVGIGVNRSFEQEPKTVSGICYKLNNPIEIAGVEINSLTVHPFNMDPIMAPDGKTSLVLMLPSGYQYWKKVGEDRAEYEKEKDQIAAKIIGALEQRYPGITSQVEVLDVATPLTFERYTGNWQGSFEGWLITPENSYTLMKRMSQTLPGLQNFYMCGQWVEPGGGLPTSVMSGRRLVKTLCREDKKKFNTSIV